jgi:hypothetical protein
MSGTRRWITRLVATAILAFGLASQGGGATDKNSATVSKPRLIVLTDMGNEPDDLESMVRLLLYANDLDIEALVATTSTWLRDKVNREMIVERVRAYSEVLPNLRVHANGYPDADVLLKRVHSGSPVYGMSGVGGGKDTEASRAIIAAVDKPDPRPLWVTVWGGVADLAQALWTVRATRSPAEVEKFVAKLRVYSISDQDDAGPWARGNFPKLFWIVSVHAFSQYGLAAWPGISADVPGADPAPVSKQWLAENIQSKGPLGKLYPTPQYIMEGDTPSFLYLIPTGLGDPGHPDWGSWGGRYDQLASQVGLWGDVQDTVIGIDGKPITANKATVWRWRSAFQNDFAARMSWTVAPKFAAANHPPQLVLNGIAGDAPVLISACIGQPVRLSARGARDPDGQSLKLRWWQYNEATGLFSLDARLEQSEGPDTSVIVTSRAGAPPNYAFPDLVPTHVILEATDNGTPALTRYRRAVISVPSATAPAELRKNCPGRS